MLLNFLEINETKPCVSAAMECRALPGWVLVPALLPDEQHGILGTLICLGSAVPGVFYQSRLAFGWGKTLKSACLETT